MSYRYDASRTALLTPARGASFFPAGRPSDEAALCAELSRLCYAPFDSDADTKREVEAALSRIGFSICTFFSAGGTQAFLACDKAKALNVLVFRGTETKRADWWTDLQAWPCPWSKGGRVHEGFAEAFELVWPELGPQVEAAQGRRLYTGHSLGAALATLAASRLAPDALYTFGSPRVGDAAFLQTIASVKACRYTNCCDLICRLPMELFGYRHHGQTIYLDRWGGQHPARGYRGGLLDRARARLSYATTLSWRRGTLWFRDLADHSPVNYFSALSQSE